MGIDQNCSASTYEKETARSRTGNHEITAAPAGSSGPYPARPGNPYLLFERSREVPLVQEKPSTNTSIAYQKFSIPDRAETGTNRTIIGAKSHLAGGIKKHYIIDYREETYLRPHFI